MSADATINITTNADTSAFDAYASSLGQLNDQAQRTTTTTASFTDTLSTSARVGDTAVLAVDRLQISQDIVTNATIRHQLAQDRLSQLQESGRATTDQLNKAQLELQISTDNLTVAHTRQEERLLSTALIAIPRMISGLKELSTVFRANTVDAEGNAIATEALTSAQLANIAVATLGVGVPVALAALALVQGANVGGNTTNLYGNVSINGADTSNISATTSQFAMSARP